MCVCAVHSSNFQLHNLTQLSYIYQYSFVFDPIKKARTSAPLPTNDLCAFITIFDIFAAQSDQIFAHHPFKPQQLRCLLCSGGNSFCALFFPSSFFRDIHAAQSTFIPPKMCCCGSLQRSGVGSPSVESFTGSPWAVNRLSEARHDVELIKSRTSTA